LQFFILLFALLFFLLFPSSKIQAADPVCSIDVSVNGTSATFTAYANGGGDPDSVSGIVEPGYPGAGTITFSGYKATGISFTRNNINAGTWTAALYVSDEMGSCDDFESYTIAGAPPPDPECDDNADNDGDGEIDYPADPGCAGLNDDDESNAEPTSTPTPTGSLTVTVSSSPPGTSVETSWFIDNGVGAGSGDYAFYGDLPLETYWITVNDPVGWDCGLGQYWRTLTTAAPDKAFNITCDSVPVIDTTPPVTTLANITSPRNTNLGTISGTATDNVSLAIDGVRLVIRDMTAVPIVDWDPTPPGSWAPPGLRIYPTMTPPSGPSVNWSYNAAAATLTNEHTYRIYVDGTDTSNNSSAWNTFQDVIFDNQLPTGTITSIPSPTNTRLTSAGQSNGTIAGTASDNLSIASVANNGLLLVIREWNPAGGVEGACDTFNRDWTGSVWVAACSATLTPNTSPALPNASVNWTYSSTPTTALMTTGRRYHIFLNVIDTAGNASNWVPNVSILYQANEPPVVWNVTALEPDYCQVGPAIIVQWTYTDVNNVPVGADPQSAYRMQIDDNASFNSPEFDTGKLNGTTTSYYASSGLTWGKTYRARVMVWDSTDTPSAWTNQTFCVGPVDANSGESNPGCSQEPLDNENDWKSPQNQYPSGVTTFSWTPAFPTQNQLVQFDASSTQCYKTPPNSPDGCRRWDWTFGDGGTVNQQNPTHTYTSYSIYTVRLRVQDQQNGYHCSADKNITVQQPVPSWREVLPQ